MPGGGVLTPPATLESRTGLALTGTCSSPGSARSTYSSISSARTCGSSATSRGARAMPQGTCGTFEGADDRSHGTRPCSPCDHPVQPPAMIKPLFGGAQLGRIGELRFADERRQRTPLGSRRARVGPPQDRRRRRPRRGRRVPARHGVRRGGRLLGVRCDRGAARHRDPHRGAARAHQLDPTAVETRGPGPFTGDQFPSHRRWRRPTGPDRDDFRSRLWSTHQSRSIRAREEP